MRECYQRTADIRRISYSTKTSSRRRRTLGSAAMISRMMAVLSKTPEIGRVKNNRSSCLLRQV